MSRVLEADETGSLTIPPEILGHPTARARYVVETEGQAIHIEPEATSDESGSQSHEQWMKEWRSLVKRIGKASITDRSAVDILSEMRR